MAKGNVSLLSVHRIADPDDGMVSGTNSSDVTSEVLRNLLRSVARDERHFPSLFVGVDDFKPSCQSWGVK